MIHLNVRENDIILLLGAGASVDAGIPHSNRMIELIEEKVRQTELEPLYHLVKSAIYFSEGAKGRYGNSVVYNIETLVSCLEELGKRDDHPLYPFIGSWSPKLQEVAGADFSKVNELRLLILQQLRTEWVANPDIENIEYFERLVEFQQGYGYPLKVFTLNYDLCVERAWKHRMGNYPERGFEARTWTWKKFDSGTDTAENLYLYKLHGSTDWVRKDGELIFKDEHLRIDHEEAAIIFGSSYKLQYVDPFLYLAYEFRRWTLEAELILCVGYGFGDEHINGILRQALAASETRVLASVGPVDSEDDEVERICGILELEDVDDRIRSIDKKAKEFFENELHMDLVDQLMIEGDTPF